MKAHHIAIVAALAANPLIAGTDAPAPDAQLARQEEKFGSFFDVLPYSPTLGLSLWPDDDLRVVTSRYEAPERRPSADDVKDMQRRFNLRWTADYSKLGADQELGFADGEGSAVLLRVRDSFDMLYADSKPASFLWVDNRITGQQGELLKAAGMVDIFLDPLYNRTVKRSILGIENPYRIWFRLGAEIDYNTLDAAAASDTQRFYALATFKANPDQKARFLGIDGLEMRSPQFVQLGAVYERNNLTGIDSWTPMLGWEPRFSWDEGVATVGRGFGLNRRMYFAKDHFPTLATAHPEVAREMGASMAEGTNEALCLEPGPLYTFIRPSVQILGESDARTALTNIADDARAGDLAKYRDAVVTYNVRVGFGLDFSGRDPSAKKSDLEVSYTLNGIHPLADLGSSHIWHEFRAEWNIAQSVANGLRANGGANGNTWNGLTAYLSYVKGEPAPSFQDTDLLTAGVALRF